MKTRRTTRIEFRLEFTEARQLFEHLSRIKAGPLNRGLNLPACLTIRENPCCAGAAIENYRDDFRRGLSPLALGSDIDPGKWHRAPSLLDKTPRTRAVRIWRGRRRCPPRPSWLGDRSLSGGAMDFRRRPGCPVGGERGLFYRTPGRAGIFRDLIEAPKNLSGSLASAPVAGSGAPSS